MSKDRYTGPARVPDWRWLRGYPPGLVEMQYRDWWTAEIMRATYALERGDRKEQRAAQKFMDKQGWIEDWETNFGGQR